MCLQCEINKLKKLIQIFYRNVGKLNQSRYSPLTAIENAGLRKPSLLPQRANYKVSSKSTLVALSVLCSKYFS
jgi:hypothetical protein